MVLTVTLNPLLEKRIFVGTGSDDYLYTAGGKGINVSRQLNLLRVKNQAVTFTGGKSGKILKNIILNEKINLIPIPCKSETRIADITIDINSKKTNTSFGENSIPSSNEISEFIKRLEKMIINSSIVVFAGSAPTDESAEIFLSGIDMAHKHDKISVLDTYGKHLELSLSKSPTIVHNNISEIENSFSIELKSENQKLDYLDFLKSNGVNIAYLTDGKNPIYAAKFGYYYKSSPPQIAEFDPAGSGDSFVAAIVHGLERSLVFNDSLRNAISIGALNAEEWQTSQIDFDMIGKHKDKIKIEEVGKKMKLIDDSPNTIS